MLVIKPKLDTLIKFFELFKGYLSLFMHMCWCKNLEHSDYYWTLFLIIAFLFFVHNVCIKYENRMFKYSKWVAQSYLCRHIIIVKFWAQKNVFYFDFYRGRSRSARVDQILGIKFPQITYENLDKNNFQAWKSRCINSWWEKACGT